jgi:hypothetical protein
MQRHHAYQVPQGRQNPRPRPSRPYIGCRLRLLVKEPDSQTNLKKKLSAGKRRYSPDSPSAIRTPHLNVPLRPKKNRTRDNAGPAGYIRDNPGRSRTIRATFPVWLLLGAPRLLNPRPNGVQACPEGLESGLRLLRSLRLLMFNPSSILFILSVPAFVSFAFFRGNSFGCYSFPFLQIAGAGFARLAHRMARAPQPSSIFAPFSIKQFLFSQLVLLTRMSCAL